MDADTAIGGAQGRFPSTQRSLLEAAASGLPGEALDKMVGSSVKGMVVGLLTGWFAQKVLSMKWGIVVGSAFGLLFAFFVAAMDTVNERHPYLEIMAPGFVVSAIVGFLTQKLGRRRAA